MANVFGILTAITLVLAGLLAYKNQGACEIEKSATEAQKEVLAKSQKSFKTAQDGITATLAKCAEIDAEAVALTDKEAALQKAIDTLTQEKAAKSAKVDPNKAKLDAVREKTAKVGDLKELAAKMRTIKGELETTHQSLTSAEAKLADLVAMNRQAENQAAIAKEKFEKFTTGQSLATLNARIRTIYPTWGFVTLNAGNNGGVVANSTLDVMRGGSAIAKLLVTAVEPNSSLASIIPDSANPNVTLMVGDKVIAASKAPSPPQRSTATKALPTATPPAATPPAADPAADPAASAAPAPAADPAAAPAAPAADPAAAAPAAAPAADPAPAASPAADPFAAPAAADPAAPAAPAAGTL